jgi:3-phytase
VPLTYKDGKPARGLPPETGSEIAVDFHRNPIPPSQERGLDLEGIALAEDGTFWMAEEYGPSLLQFSADGVLLNELSPGKGLPDYFKYRRMNRGFEGVAVRGKTVWGALESPLDNPPSKLEANSKNSRLTRLIEMDPARKVALAQFAYILDEADTGKINDICFDSPETLLVLERGNAGKGKTWKKIYRAHLSAATNLQRLSSRIGGKTGTLESLLPKDFAVNCLAPVKKELVADLSKLGVHEDKPEGISMVDDKFIAVMIDNDFGMAGGLDHVNAIAETKDEPAALYFVPIKR